MVRARWSQELKCLVLLLHKLGAVQDNNVRHRRSVRSEPILSSTTRASAVPYVREATPSLIGLKSNQSGRACEAPERAGMKKCAEAEDDGSGQASKGSRGSDPRPRGPTVGKSSLTAHVGSDPVHQASYALGSDQPFARIYHRHRKITIAKKTTHWHTQGRRRSRRRTVDR